MGRIIWDTDSNSPAAGQIVDAATGRSILVQADWDYPSVASSFGWSVRSVQPQVRYCCGDAEHCGDAECQECNEAALIACAKLTCDHEGTDGTVTCPDCGLTASDFISAAADWLADNDGAEAEDEEFMILLSTGGPALRIRGELSSGEPDRAWLEYQDWGTPWTEHVATGSDHAALLTFCRVFYFGA